MKPEKILVVEDDGITALDLQHILEEYGYTVPAKVHSGEKALEQAGKMNFDLALMDINLSGNLNGIQTSQRLWDQFRLPTVYLTAYADETTLLQAEQTSPFGFLMKPFQTRAVCATLRMAFQKIQLEKDSRSDYEVLHDGLKSARAFQNYLPRIPLPTFIKSSSIYLPCSEVSGDMYHLSRTRTGDLNVFLGDAMGHGVKTATMNMMVQMALDNMPLHLPPNEILFQLNTILRDHKIVNYMTGIFLRITSQGLLTAAHAGHPPLIIIPAHSGKAEVFQEYGGPLGLFRGESQTPYVIEQYSLQPGDLVILYTDGVIDWMNSNKELFGKQRLIHFLLHNRLPDLDDLFHQLLFYLRQFSQNCPCQDDVTILGLRYIGGSYEFGRYHD